MRNPTETEEVSMRKVVASELVSLDSVLEDPSWTFQFSTEDWSWVA